MLSIRVCSLALCLNGALLSFDAVDVALQQLNKPYEWGASGPDSFDCSGLTQFAYKQVGITIPKYSGDQALVGTLATQPFQRGDLIFFATDDTAPGAVSHVGIYEGGNVMINAVWYGIGVRSDDITSGYWAPRLLFGRRIQPTAYTITDLGTLLNMETSEASGINASGQVVGTAKTFATQRAFLYTPGQPLIDIGTLGGRWSYGDAINADGQVTGVFDTTTGGRAYLYTPGSGMTDLGTLAGFSGASRGLAINASGQVAGESITIEGRAFLYRPGVGMTTFNFPDNHLGSAARGINDVGQVTGYFSTDGGAVQRAFVYTPGQGVVDIRALTGQPLQGGLAINASGQVTGGTETGNAFVYTPPASVTIIAPASGGNSINSFGHVVGYTSTGPQQGYAFLYTPTRGVVNLNTLLPANSGWTLITATGINDAGQITGTGRNPGGQIRAFLLTSASAGAQ